MGMSRPYLDVSTVLGDKQRRRKAYQNPVVRRAFGMSSEEHSGNFEWDIPPDGSSYLRHAMEVSRSNRAPQTSSGWDTSRHNSHGLR